MFSAAAIEAERLIEVVVLPTPPLPEVVTIMRLMTVVETGT